MSSSLFPKSHQAVMWNAMLVRTTVYSRMAKMVYTVVRTQGTGRDKPPSLPPRGLLIDHHHCITTQRTQWQAVPKTTATAILHITENITTVP